jgi:hypothetical protein
MKNIEEKLAKKKKNFFFFFTISLILTSKKTSLHFLNFIEISRIDSFLFSFSKCKKTKINFPLSLQITSFFFIK